MMKIGCRVGKDMAPRKANTRTRSSKLKDFKKSLNGKSVEDNTKPPILAIA